MMENKNRNKEIANLRINGISKKDFYKLYYYETKYQFLLAVIFCLIGYIGVIVILEEQFSVIDLLIVFTESIIYVFLTCIMPLLISMKQIFIKDREAYPLKLNATDEEDSKVEQTAALEEPLQSKAIFFDNKKMLQKSRACDGVTFMFARLNTMYCSRQFKVKIVVNKDYCMLKFTEYTMEEDIIHVLFSLIGTTGLAE